MGFLDHSTNNIILDAVLTDIGREFLAKNDGSFSLVKFAMSDDEIDYSIIQKFGRSVGREKIEKLTPVFEALTNQNFAQKFKMISISNPNLLKLPTLGLTGEGLDSTNSILSMGRSGVGRARRIILAQSIQDEDSIDVELRDQAFIVKLPNDLVEISGRSPDNIDQDNIATYLITRDALSTATGGSQGTIDLKVKSISNSTFTVKGNSNDKTTISAYANVTGLQSGVSSDINLQIAKES